MSRSSICPTNPHRRRRVVKQIDRIDRAHIDPIGGTGTGRRALGAVAGVLLLAAPALAVGAAPADRPAPLSVTAEPGQVDRAAAALRAGALRVQRRHGSRLEVVASPSRAAALRRLPGVAAVSPAPTAFPDEIVSQGMDRLGAPVLEPVADGGRGLTIAVLDLGFGYGIPARQAAGELPPETRLELRSFNPSFGLAGRNAYGNQTNHGELVAQTVFDYAPLATYVFVSYQTEGDFVAAVDWLVQRRPDIVVHSNNFLEGPMDGTGPLAQAVDRLAAAGILWFNSAGNYGQSHWAGDWADADGDERFDWPTEWSFTRDANKPITFALSWEDGEDGIRTDLDLVLERQEADGSWTAVAASRDRQAAGAGPSERITGYLSPVGGAFRVRIALASGPAPVGAMSLFSREVPLGAAGAVTTSSVPTPGDAAGAVTVGAVDWRGNTLKAYSSRGPTVDGRPKPDLVASTNTRVLGPSGPRAVGGTSIAAPNAAGAAALLLAAQRAAGFAPTAADVRAMLAGSALDLGDPGPDASFGAGRVRVDLDPPQILPQSPLPNELVRGRLRLAFTAEDPSPVAAWSMSLDGVGLVGGQRGAPTSREVDTRRMPDGTHTLRGEALDWPGNGGAGEWTFEVDNTVPTLAIRRFLVVPPPRPPRLPPKERARRIRLDLPLRPPPRPRPTFVTLRATDERGGPMTLDLTLLDASGRGVLTREIPFRAVGGRRLGLGRLERGGYRLALLLTDQAGNARRVTRGFGVS